MVPVEQGKLLTGLGELVFNGRVHCTESRVNRGGVIDTEAAHGFGTIRDHAREVVALRLLAAEGLALHRLGRDLATFG